VRYDPGGTLWWKLQWQGEDLEELRLRLPDRRWLVLRRAAVLDPVLGPVFPLAVADDLEDAGAPCAFVADCSWTKPCFVPAVDRPGQLPPGAGSGLLSFLAEAALAKGRPALRYRGPYPTGALFDTLLECFRVDDLTRSWAVFSDAQQGVDGWGAFVEVPVDFHPDPLWRSWPAEGVCFQGRRQVERAWVQGQAFDRRGPCRLEGDGPYTLAFVLGERRLLTLGHLDEAGQIDGAVRLGVPDLSGGALSPQLQATLGEALLQRVPVALRPLAATWWAQLRIELGRCGWSAARWERDALVLHPAWPLALQGRDPSEAVVCLYRALEPAFLAGLQQRILHLRRAAYLSIG
jgi:hypothetical protein